MCRMRNILLFSAATAAAVSAVAPKAHQLDDSYTFEQYLSHFDKSYDDPAEYDRRSDIFAKNMKKILRHNVGKMTGDGDVIEGYVMGVNRFTDVARDELPMGYNKALHPAWGTQLARGGAVMSTERLLGATNTVTTSYSQSPDFTMDEVADLPDSVDWAESGNVNPIIPNQGVCGSCWSFAATATIESMLSIATGEDPISLSEQNMLECSPNPNQCGGEGGCTGSTAELGFNYIADISTKNEGGMFTIEDLPYDLAGVGEGDDKCSALTEGKTAMVGITGWTLLPSNSYKATMNALAKVGPMVVALAASKWMSYESGIFDEPDSDVNHAVLLVGYGTDDNGEKYYKIRNSWGEHYGEHGYIRIKRTDNDDNECSMDNDPLKGISCALNDEGDEVHVDPIKVCGQSAVLFDVSYPVGAFHFD